MNFNNKFYKKIYCLFLSYTAKNIYLVNIANTVLVLTGFLFTILVARNLSPDDFGLFSAVTSLILVLSDLGELGIGGGLSSFLPPLLKNKDESNSNKILKTTFLLQILFSVSISLLVIIFAKQLTQLIFQSTSTKLLGLVKLSVIGIFSFMMFNYFNSVLSAKERFDKSLITQSAYAIPRLLLLAVAIIRGNLSLVILLLIFITAPFIGLFFSVTFISFKFLSTDGFYPLRKIFKFSLFLALNKLFIALFSRLDILMLSALANSYSAGIYSAASRISFIYTLIGSSLGTVFAPKYAKISVAEAISFSKKVFLLILALVVSVIGLIIIAPVIVSLIYGLQYANSVLVLRVLLIGMIPFLCAIPLNSMLVYTYKKPQIIAISSFIQLLIIISGNLLLIPKINSLAAAVSIAIASLAALLISMVSLLLLQKQKYG